MQTPSLLAKVRFLGLLEGISFLLLLLVAMPLKYWAGYAPAVYAVGSIHGILFVLYVGYLFAAAASTPLPWRYAGLGVIAALLPLGPFVLDRGLRRFDRPVSNPSVRG